MTASRGYSSLFLPCIVAMLAIECASTAGSISYPLSPAITASLDGLVRYRVPDGWFDASADSGAVGHVVWLVSSDLGATLALDEVRIDPGIRRRLDQGSLAEIARLLRTLRASWEGLVEVSAPECLTLDGRDVCVYLLARPSTGEMHRVALLDTGRRVYTATLVMTERQEGVRAQQRTDAQDAFVLSIQW